MPILQELIGMESINRPKYKYDKYKSKSETALSATRQYSTHATRLKQLAKEIISQEKYSNFAKYCKVGDYHNMENVVYSDYTEGYTPSYIYSHIVFVKNFVNSSEAFQNELQMKLSNYLRHNKLPGKIYCKNDSKHDGLLFIWKILLSELEPATEGLFGKRINKLSEKSILIQFQNEIDKVLNPHLKKLQQTLESSIERKYPEMNNYYGRGSDKPFIINLNTSNAKLCAIIGELTYELEFDDPINKKGAACLSKLHIELNAYLTKNKLPGGIYIVDETGSITDPITHHNSTNDPCSLVLEWMIPLEELGINIEF